MNDSDRALVDAVIRAVPIEDPQPDDPSDDEIRQIFHASLDAGRARQAEQDAWWRYELEPMVRYVAEQLGGALPPGVTLSFVGETAPNPFTVFPGTTVLARWTGRDDG